MHDPAFFDYPDCSVVVFLMRSEIPDELDGLDRSRRIQNDWGSMVERLLNKFQDHGDRLAPLPLASWQLAACTNGTCQGGPGCMSLQRIRQV